MIGLLTRRLVDVIHFVYHLNPTAWVLIWNIITHQYVRWSYHFYTVTWWNCYFVLDGVILYFWLLLPEIHHATGSYHWGLLIGVAFICLILVHSHSHSYTFFGGVEQSWISLAIAYGFCHVPSSIEINISRFLLFYINTSTLLLWFWNSTIIVVDLSFFPEVVLWR